MILTWAETPIDVQNDPAICFFYWRFQHFDIIVLLTAKNALHGFNTSPSTVPLKTTMMSFSLAMVNNLSEKNC